jgi:tetratricopeptide (TPR) repeat protein
MAMMAKKLGKIIIAGAMMLFVSSCAEKPAQQLNGIVTAASSKKHNSYVNSELAAFMVGQYALKKGDLAVAADAFTIALAYNQNNPYLLNLAFQTQYYSGDIEAASDLAARIERSDDYIMLSGEPAASLVAIERDWQALYVLAKHMAADGRSHQTGTIMAAWALAAQGQGDAGLVMLDSIDQFEDGNISQTRLSQKALMAEFIGHSELAVAYALDILEQDHLDQNVVLHMAGILLRNDEVDEGKLWINRLGLRFPRNRLLSEIENGTSPLLDHPDVISIIATGIVTSQIDPIQNSYQPNSLARLYLAAYLDQNNDYAKYLIAESYIDAELIDDGVATLSLVSHDSPWFIEARMSMVTALRSEESNKALALKIVNDLLDDYPDNPLIWAEKGLTAQRNLLHAEAEEAFMKAIELGLDNGRIQYYLAITQADQGKNDMAEASFRRSIELAPFNAYSLNYFGYWLIEQNRHLDEAKAFIQKAVDKQPENGAFVDSLGWVYFKLGDYDNALIFMERAAMLIPDDPVITDHLGDVYWALDRPAEALHEWRRALIFSPDDALKVQVESKIARMLADE